MKRILSLIFLLALLAMALEFNYLSPNIRGIIILCTTSTAAIMAVYLLYLSYSIPIETDIQRRLRWYKIALEEIEEGRENWTCFAIAHNCPDFLKLWKTTAAYELMPELHKYRTFWEDAIWFKDKEERLRALRASINQLKDLP